jgi:hypothetical protein
MASKFFGFKKQQPGVAAPSMGTPGFNPGAQDPRIPQGPPPPMLNAGIPGGAMPAPQRQQPPNPMEVPEAPPMDMSGMNPLSQIGLVMADTAAGMRGQSQMPSQMAVQQRQKMYEQKRQQWMQGLQLLGEMQKKLDDVPVEQRTNKAAALRKQFEAWAGKGSGVMFDDVVGDGQISKGMLQMMEKSPALQTLMAQGGSYSDLRQYAKSEQGLREAMEYQDNELFPTAAEKVRSLQNDPKARARRDELARDGALSISDIKQLSDEFGTDGAKGNRISASEFGTLTRKQLELSQNVPGVKTAEQMEGSRQLKEKEESDIRIEDAKQAAELEYNTNQGNGGVSLDPATRQVLVAEYKDSAKQIQDADSALDYLRELDSSLRKAEHVLTGTAPDTEGDADPKATASDKLLDTGPLMRIPGAGLTQQMMNSDNRAVVEQAFGEEWVGKVRTSAPKGAFSDREGLALERTIGSFGKGNPFNLRDIRERRKFIAELRTRKEEQRENSVYNRDSIAKRVDLGDLRTSTTRDAGAGGQAPVDRAEIKRRFDAGEITREQAKKLLGVQK